MIVRSPRPANLAVVCLRKVVSLADGKEDTSRYATGFLYRDSSKITWLVTNWHVLTGRRPDAHGVLLGGSGQSPHAIEVMFPSKQRGHFLPPVEYKLYDHGTPVWSQYKLESGLDIAAIPINIPQDAAGICIQDFSSASKDAMEPGVDLVVVGFPFKNSKDTPFPLWKRAMLASEPNYLQFGQPQLLIDTPGVPGMPGSPVFRTSDAFLADSKTAALFADVEAGRITSSDLISQLDPTQLSNRTVGLAFVGIYAGATGNKDLEHLQLGRMYPASVVDLLIKEPERGHNPFPP